MTITNLNVFQSGTLASVTPINENFETLRVEVNTLENTVTTNKTYLDNKVTELNTNIAESASGIKAAGEVFCVNGGPVDLNGDAAIISYSGSTLSFSTPFSITNVKGTKYTATSLQSISVSGYADGAYNVFMDTNGEIEIFACTIYKQKTTPNGVLNNIWLNISKAPLEAKRYTSSGWVDFLKVPVGNFYVSNGEITKVTTYAYNQNGYTLNHESMPSVIYAPDYTKPVGKANGVTYVADTYGWLYLYYVASSINEGCTFYIDNQTFTVAYSQFIGSGYGAGGGYMLPVPKGSSYMGVNVGTMIFYPAKTY